MLRYILYSEETCSIACAISRFLGGIFSPSVSVCLYLFLFSFFSLLSYSLSISICLSIYSRSHITSPKCFCAGTPEGSDPAHSIPLQRRVRRRLFLQAAGNPQDPGEEQKTAQDSPRFGRRSRQSLRAQVGAGRDAGNPLGRH